MNNVSSYASVVCKDALETIRYDKREYKDALKKRMAQFCVWLH